MKPMKSGLQTQPVSRKNSISSSALDNYIINSQQSKIHELESKLKRALSSVNVDRNDANTKLLGVKNSKFGKQTVKTLKAKKLKT